MCPETRHNVRRYHAPAFGHVRGNSIIILNLNSMDDRKQQGGQQGQNQKGQNGQAMGQGGNQAQNQFGGDKNKQQQGGSTSNYNQDTTE